MPSNKKQNSLALPSLVLAFLIPPVGLVLSVVSFTQIRERKESGRGMAVAGFIISALITFSPFSFILLISAYQALSRF
ncbi:DUF4190 domain-containing protein [Candidatus Parcubacteria bacterium]|nr:DUF4190 domain-containing protein [Candidatus Parcubacteria bacterium]